MRNNMNKSYTPEFGYQQVRLKILLFALRSTKGSPAKTGALSTLSCGWTCVRVVPRASPRSQLREVWVRGTLMSAAPRNQRVAADSSVTSGSGRAVGELLVEASDEIGPVNVRPSDAGCGNMTRTAFASWRDAR
jgi:hypothetical protein